MRLLSSSSKISTNKAVSMMDREVLFFPVEKYFSRSLAHLSLEGNNNLFHILIYIQKYIYIVNRDTVQSVKTPYIMHRDVK